MNFKLPMEVIEDIPKYKESLNRFLSGDESAARFKGTRVPWGFYSHRKGIEKNVYMARIRLPGGVVNGKQLKALAEASRKFAAGVLHVTDRQDIQIHFVPIENTGKLIEYLKDYDLSPRGGGGNTVRNITSCSLSGICDKEIFDVRGYAIALTEYLLKDEVSYNLPRKFKIAFSACSTDCALATVNDVGFIAKKKVIDGVEVNGFSVYVGGGMGASSRVADLFEEFIKPEEIGYTAEAVKRAFNKYGNRKDKHHARLRFLIEKIGINEFKKLYNEELENLKKSEKIKLRDVEFNYPISEAEDILGVENNKEFNIFKKHNIIEHKQKGFYMIEIKIKLGDIKADDLEKLGFLEDEFPEIEYRTSHRQNILICNVHGKDVYPIYRKLREFDLATPYASTVLDVVCCAGASTCNLGICDSKAMACKLVETLEESLNLNDIEKLNDISIKINGCPNACGQAPVGFIGIAGATNRIDGRMVPFYKISLGGIVEEGRTQLNKAIGSIPARNTPEALKDFLTGVQQRIGHYKNAYKYLESEGIEAMKKIINKYSHVPSYSKNPSYYRDWYKVEDFTLAGIGSAECGAGVMEIIESDIADANRSITIAEKNLDVRPIKDALHYSARALLVVRGIDPKTLEETFGGFIKEIVNHGFCSPKFRDVKNVYDSLNSDSNISEKKEKLTLAKELLEDVREAFKLMDNNFNLQKRYSFEGSV